MTIIFSITATGFGQKESAKQFTIENGLRVFLLEKRSLPLVNIVAAVNLGSKDETDETNGLVHILEHLILFRGTEFRSGREVSRDIRRYGAYFNAHTGQDIALFEISLPSKYADFALENQREILFHLKIAQEALDQEKEIILEELRQVEDDPLRLAISLVYQKLFKGHPYERPIYGKKEIINSISVEQVEDFYNKYFVPENCTLAVVGDFSVEDMEKKVRHAFIDVKGGEFVPPQLEKAPFLKDGEEMKIEMDINKAYLVIGIPGPDYNDPDQYAVDVLTEVLGRGVNPMLNSILRRRRDLIQTVSMSYNAMKYGGVVLIVLTLDPKNVSAAKKEAISFLKRARNENYSKDDFYGEAAFYAYDYLESAKNLIKFLSLQAQERGLAVATSLAQFMLLNENPARGSYLENIEKMTSSDLRRVAGTYFSKGEYVVVSVLPKKTK